MTVKNLMQSSQYRLGLVLSNDKNVIPKTLQIVALSMLQQGHVNTLIIELRPTVFLWLRM